MWQLFPALFAMEDTCHNVVDLRPILHHLVVAKRVHIMLDLAVLGRGCIIYIYVDLCMFLSCSQHLLTRFHKYVLQSVLICMVAMLPTEPEAQSLAFSDSCATSSQSQEHPPNSKIPEPK